MGKHGHGRCECGGAFELTDHAMHFAARRCTGCARWAGWCRSPEKMATHELIVELDRLDALLSSRGLESPEIKMLDVLVRRARRYVEAMPAPYRALMREATRRLVERDDKALGMALQWPLAKLEAHGAWPEPKAREQVRPGAMASLFNLFDEEVA